MAENYEVKNNTRAGRFEVQIDGNLAVLDYQLDGQVMTITHTEVPEALGGRGIAGQMAQTALDFAKANQYSVLPLCSFINTYIRRHPEYQNLVK
jgi:uncharacterized protein